MAALGATAPDVEVLDGGHLRIVAPFDAAGASALGLAGPLDWVNLSDEGLPPVPGLDPILRSTTTTYVFFPNLLVSFTPGGVLNFAVWPGDEETTLLDATWLAPDWGEEDSPAELPAWSERIEWAQAQLDSVAAALDGAQEEMKEPARQGLSLQDDSEAVRLWNEALDDRLRALVAPDALTGAAPGEVRSPLAR